jgi:hypothetical protein
MTFLNNNIKLDEICTHRSERVDSKLYTPNTSIKTADNLFSEWDYATKPTLDWIAKHHPEINIIEKTEKEKTEKEIAIDVLNVLVDIHEKRTREYIEKYGYDEWEGMFKFPDWREREAYLEQMENETNDSEYDEYEDEYEDEN